VSAKDDLRQVKLGTSAAHLEEHARDIAEALRRALPKGVGFTLFIFDQDKAEERKPGHFTYISTADRADMVATLRDFLGKAAP
jgi:hypothetical protein